MSSLLNAQDNTCTGTKNCLLSVRSMSVEFTLPDQSKSRPVENVDLDIKAGNIRQGDSLRIVDRVYKAAFEIMVSAGENE